MKVSIITSVYNNKHYIAGALESVSSQSHTDIEHIVVDGGSTDGTKEIIQQHRDKISIYISEKDSGIYDALNKGIKLATGDVIGFLHSDDLFYSDKTIESIVDKFKECHTDSVFGDLIYVSASNTDKVIRYWKSKDFHRRKLFNGWMPPHPTFFVKRDIYEKYGNFDTDFRIAADYDLMMRMLGKYKISTVYLPEIITRMRVGGESNKSLKNIIKKSREDFKVIQKNKIGGIRTLIGKNLSKINQFIHKK